MLLLSVDTDRTPEHQLYEVEMRCALVEAETREEVMEEMEERMHDMEKMFKRRLMKEVCPWEAFSTD